MRATSLVTLAAVAAVAQAGGAVFQAIDAMVATSAVVPQLPQPTVTGCHVASPGMAPLTLSGSNVSHGDKTGVLKGASTTSDATNNGSTQVNGFSRPSFPEKMQSSMVGLLGFCIVGLIVL